MFQGGREREGGGGAGRRRSPAAASRGRREREWVECVGEVGKKGGRRGNGAKVTNLIAGTTDKYFHL